MNELLEPLTARSQAPPANPCWRSRNELGVPLATFPRQPEGSPLDAVVMGRVGLGAGLRSNDLPWPQPSEVRVHADPFGRVETVGCLLVLDTAKLRGEGGLAEDSEPEVSVEGAFHGTSATVMSVMADKP
jgi:hypothetical protein